MPRRVFQAVIDREEAGAVSIRALKIISPLRLGPVRLIGEIIPVTFRMFKIWVAHKMRVPFDSPGTLPSGSEKSTPFSAVFKFAF